MEKATIVLLALFFGFFLIPGISFACGGGHGHDGAGGHEMMQPEGNGGKGRICPCHGASDKQDVPGTAPVPSKSDGVKPGKSTREMSQHHPGFDEKSGEGHQCPHHK